MTKQIVNKPDNIDTVEINTGFIAVFNDKPSDQTVLLVKVRLKKL